MIPYFAFHVFYLGPVPVQVWGLCVAAGMLAAAWVAVQLAKQRGQTPAVIWDLLFWVMLGSFFFARLFHVVLYNLNFYTEFPGKILAVWDGGFSFVGGLFGAAVAGVWFLRNKNLDVWAYVDTAMFGLPVGIGIGRIGCFLIHDHPGTLTHFILGVHYPDGFVRHDLGLYESINGFVLFLIFFVLLKRKAPVGTFTVTFLIWYGVTRFFLDFLRINDVRYFGLTPSQYLAILLLGTGAWLWKKKLSAKN